jgi:predicted GNAT family acetyltransferase
MKENYLKLLLNLILILILYNSNNDEIMKSSISFVLCGAAKSMMVMRISGTKNLSKTFIKNSIKGKGWGLDFFNDAKHKTNNDNIFYALNRINIQLDNSVTAFIGKLTIKTNNNN